MSTTPTPQSAASMFDRRFTAILVVLSGYTILASVALWRFEALPTLARIPLALPILVLTPGYAIVTALFPTSPRAPHETSTRKRTNSYVPDGLPFAERIAVAVVASIAVVPFVVLIVDVFTGFSLTYVLASVSAITVVAAGIAIFRRSRLETAPVGGSTGSTRRRVGLDKVTAVAIVVAVLLVASTAAFALTGPGLTDSPDQTEFYVGNTTETGDFVASGYPKAFAPGEEKTYLLNVRSNSDDPQQYEIVAVLVGPNSESESDSSTELSRVSTTVQPGETATVTYPVAPPREGENLTLQFLLYRGSAPERPSAETALRALEISIDVTSDASSESQN